MAQEVAYECVTGGARIDTGFLAAVLVAAVLVYDRLGGNHELSRRLFQVGLAISLVFVVVSGTAAFIRAGNGHGGVLFGSSNQANDVMSQLATSSAVQYGFGVGFLIAGLVMLRRYHTVPLSLILSGVFLLFNGPNVGAYTPAASASRIGQASSQGIDIAVFGIALAGTFALLAYGMRLEQEFASDADVEDEEPPQDSTGDSS